MPHRLTSRRWTFMSLLLVLTTLLSGCEAFVRAPTWTAVPSVREKGGLAVSSEHAAIPVRFMGVQEEEMSGLIFQLSEGAKEPTAPVSAPTVEADPLPDADTERVLGLLPDLEGEAGDTQEFLLPPRSLPAPRPGETITQTFPPEEAQAPDEQPQAGPLQVLRYSPEGDVPLAPYLSITFDQPMVPLTGMEDLAAEDVPVRLAPLPEGRWRWVGTKTLMFEPVTRFPMATEYTVEIPAGTTSAIGGTLEETISWTFRTPPPQLQASYPPDEPTVRDPLLFVAFDQQIDPAAVLQTITVKAGGQMFETELVASDEVAADEDVSRLADEAGDGRWLAFRVVGELPYDATVTVNIGPKTPSVEGPRTTEEVQSYTFKTYGPLRVVESSCGWEDNCPPLTPWSIRFSNQLDEELFDGSLVQIEPELPGAEIALFGNTLQIRGASKGRTEYRVTLKQGITDIFGQTLAEDETVTFRVGSSEPSMSVPNEMFAVLDPAAAPSYTVYTMNYGTLFVRAYRVQPEDWPAFQQYMHKTMRQESPGDPPGEKVMDQRIKVDAKTDELAQTNIDLSALLGESGQGYEHLILIVEPERNLVDFVRRRPQPVLRVWLQASKLALDAFVDSEEMTAWVTSLSNGAPLADVELTLFPGGATATTNESGVATLSLAKVAAGETGGYVLARRGDDTALLPQSAYPWMVEGWQQRPLEDTYRWYVFDDRQMYRPGEEVHVKGWVRLALINRGADQLKLPAEGEQVSYVLRDSRGNEVLQGDTELNALGGFDFSFTVPEGMNLGTASLMLKLSGGATVLGTDYWHQIQVQEFRRPEFEVTAQANEGPHFVGDDAIVTVEASYYAGGPLANAEVDWFVSSRPGVFVPPGWDRFTFGNSQPLPFRSFAYEKPYFYDDSMDGPTHTDHYEAYTGADGSHSLRIDFKSVDPPQPSSVQAEATVMDVNRQAWTASSTILVHPADLYVGLQSERTFVEQGQPIHVDAIVVDLDGQPVANRAINMRAVRLKWVYSHGEWKEEEADEQLCRVTSENEPVRCTFDTPEGGTYRITATIEDAQGRKNQTVLTRWVSGGKRPSANKVEQEEVMLIPDRDEYQPGDMAEILVQSPFAPAEGLLTVRVNGVSMWHQFHMDKATFTLQVPILEEYISNVPIQVDLVGSAPRLDDKGEVDSRLPSRPAYATGSLNLMVPPYERTLDVTVTPQDAELEPGGETVVDVVVKNAAGKAVKDAEVAVVVVDEAVLALTGYQLADPLAAFYPQRWGYVDEHYMRRFVTLADPIQLLEQSRGAAQDAAEGMVYMERSVLATTSVAEMEVAMDMAKAEEAMPAGAAPMENAAEESIRLRTDFNPLAIFAPTVTTDADGSASVPVKLPDSLTRYRIMAVAVSGEKEFGKGESTVTARLPLMVRPSPPRFLNFGDEFQLPVVLQNQTDEPMEVDVVVRATNITFTEGTGQRVTVPARDRVEVRFPATTEQAGTARFQVAATSDVSAAARDAAEFELPVYTPATTEAFAVYGTVDEGAIAQPIIAPSNAYTQFGGLEITTSSTALQALTDAVLYLTSYPFDCSEQLASRILAVAALRDVLSAFEAEGLPDPDELVAAVQRDIETLQLMQNEDGGWPIWTKGYESWPFQSIHVAHALARAREKDFDVPDEMVSLALEYLRGIESHYPKWYGEDVRNTLTAYALYVRALLGDPDPARGRRLVHEVGLEELRPEAIGWLLTVLADDAGSAEELEQIQHFLNNRVSETAGAANFITSYSEEEGYLLLASNRRADGIILEGLMLVDPQSDLIPKLVRGLLAHQVRGRWNNTQENVFILLALDRYFNTYEAQTPDFVARVWLGEQYVAEFPFEGRTTDYQSVTVPMEYLAAQGGEQPLLLNKEGEGRLYYRLGMSYAPKNLNLAPLEEGFAIQRTYEAVDDPADVWQDEQGVWHVKAGTRVRVRLRMVAPSRRYHVALVDPLPAGLEALNPALAVTGSIPQDPQDEQTGRYWWWNWTWYEHQNMRDERVEAFASLLWDGIHTYTYVARATTPGEFVVPPAKAEEMYSPEVFGRSGTDRLIVE
ncbi:MAG: hypothetical protein GX552_00140 [Chloroflexi bacterium]|nr:hypothetical protein [Chloroflexota bacterium]